MNTPDPTTRGRGRLPLARGNNKRDPPQIVRTKHLQYVRPATTCTKKIKKNRKRYLRRKKRLRYHPQQRMN